MDIIFDIDGTIADLSHRLHFIQREGKKDWKGFDENSIDDIVIPEVAFVLKELKKNGHTIILCTGRNKKMLHATLLWFKEKDIPFDDLYMRDFDGGPCPDFCFNFTCTLFPCYMFGHTGPSGNHFILGLIHFFQIKPYLEARQLIAEKLQ